MSLAANYYQEIFPVFHDDYDKDDELSCSDGTQRSQSVYLVHSIFFNKPLLVLDDEEGHEGTHEHRNWAP